MKKYHAIYIKYISVIRKCLLSMFILAIVILPNSAFGQINKEINKGWHPSPEEIWALPRYCQIKFIVHLNLFKQIGVEDKRAAIIDEFNKWAEVFDKWVYNSSHHYCAGVNFINRYKHSFIYPYKGVDGDREYVLNKALDEFGYMRGHGERLKTSKMYIPLLMNEAYVYRKQNQVMKAIANYIETIKMEPSYADAYVEYARLMNDLGKGDDAKRILQTGLKNTKGDRAIMKEMADGERGKNRDDNLNK